MGLIFFRFIQIITVDHSNEFFFCLIDIQFDLILHSLSLMRNSSPSLRFGLSQVTVCAGNAKIGRFKYNVPGSIIFWIFGFLRLYKDIHQCRAQSL